MSGSRIERPGARGLVLAGVAGAALAACAPVWRTEGRAVFTCDRGPDVTVSYHGNIASLEGVESGPLPLNRRGRHRFTFESATRTAVLDGRNLTITIGRMVPIRCRQSGRWVRP